MTPDIDNHSERAIAPPSGMLLDLAEFTVQPTFAAAFLGPSIEPAGGTGAAYMYDLPRRGIAIPPGTGLVMADSTGLLVPTAEVVVTVGED